MIVSDVAPEGEGRLRSVASEVDAHYDLAELLLQLAVLIVELGIIEEVRLLVICEEPEDQALSSGPLAEDVAVIVDRPCVLLAELVHEALREEGVVVDRVLLQIDVSVRVQELLHPVLRVCRVARSVEAAVRTSKSRL